jgi:hypothetical protein
VVTGVTTGEYTARATMGSIQDEYAVADVTVGSTDVTDVQLIATKLSIIRGRVVFEPGTAKPPLPTAVRVAASSLTPSAVMAGNATVKEDGTFEMRAGASHVQLRAFVVGPGDWRLRRVLSGGVDVTDSGIDIAPDGTIDNVIFEMTSRSPEFVAKAVDASGSPVRDCVIVIFPRNEQRWTPQSRYFAYGRPNVESIFRGRMPAGEYQAAAFEDAEQNLGIFADPEILAQLRERATPFSLREGEQTDVEIKLGPPPVY